MPNSFDPDKDIPNLTGKTFLVTGGSAGIGFGICAHLLQHGANILLLSNKEDHAEEAIEDLKQWGDSSQVEWIQCDLASLKDTDNVAKALLERKVNLAAMVLNAGLGVGNYWKTGDGLECHFQVNWLSQLHLALKLLPQLQRPGGRVVFQSSDLHRGAEAGTKFASVEEINTDIGPMKLYNRSKLAQVLGMLAIQRRLQAGGGGKYVRASASDKIYVNATHPGAVSTDQQEQAIEAYGMLGKLGVKATRPFMKDPVKSGCRSALFAAASPDVETDGITGKYIVPDRKVTDPSSKAQDEELAEQLWALSHQLIHERLGDVVY